MLLKRQPVGRLTQGRGSSLFDAVKGRVSSLFDAVKGRGSSLFDAVKGRGFFAPSREQESSFFDKVGERTRLFPIGFSPSASHLR